METYMKMNWTKKSVLIVTIAALAVTLAGCSRGTSSAATGSGTAALSSTLVISTLNNPFFVSVAAGAQAQATASGLKLDVQNANNSDQTSLDQTATAGEYSRCGIRPQAVVGHDRQLHRIRRNPGR
jgi:ribose transport system substrate-binding protein